ncbi:hypothetical protein [Paraburkholderia sp.]|uniref:hypothetical protein n=1 Tax=Paraburkholderia sp. TaxID=1926495 RepID=UPI003D6E0A6C
MQPQLRLVDGSMAKRPHCAPLVESIEPRVLTGSFTDKLALVTRAERELRSIGIRVLSVSWDEPALRIERDMAVSLKPLLDRMLKLNFRVCNEDGYDVWGHFCNVVVCWSQPLSAHLPEIVVPAVPLTTREQ